MITLVVISGTAGSRAANDVSVSRQVTTAEIGTVAVMTFDGSKGNGFSDLVAHELLQRGAKLVERTKLAAILRERGITVDDLAAGRADLKIAHELAQVETLVFGSVTSIMVYMSGVESGRVSFASFRLVQTQSGEILSSVAFNSDTEVLVKGKTYGTAASMMVERLIRK